MADPQSPGRCDLRVHEAVRRFVPDLLILVPSIDAFDQMPSRQYLDVLRAELKLPIVQLYPDLSKPIWQDLAAKLAVAADLVVSIDGLGAATVDRSANPAIEWLELWTPVAPPPGDGIVRDIDVSMLGSLRDFPHRIEAVDHLRRNGIEVMTGGGVESSYAMSFKDYFGILQRSKIVMNFSRSGSKIFAQDGSLLRNLKGRVMEALMCGALLLESENAVTASFFADGRDYVSFRDLDDLVEKIRFYLANDRAARAIAENGRRTCSDRYSAEVFWTRLLSAVEAAPSLAEQRAAVTPSTGLNRPD